MEGKVQLESHNARLPWSASKLDGQRGGVEDGDEPLVMVVACVLRIVRQERPPLKPAVRYTGLCDVVENDRLRALLGVCGHEA
jgi:hypothetical protein